MSKFLNAEEKEQLYEALQSVKESQKKIRDVLNTSGHIQTCEKLYGVYNALEKQSQKITSIGEFNKENLNKRKTPPIDWDTEDTAIWEM
jgi:hypothetical protein